MTDRTMESKPGSKFPKKKSFHIFSQKNSGDLRRSLKFFTSLFWKLGKRGNMSSAEIYWSGDKPSRGRAHMLS